MGPFQCVHLSGTLARFSIKLSLIQDHCTNSVYQKCWFFELIYDGLLDPVCIDYELLYYRLYQNSAQPEIQKHRPGFGFINVSMDTISTSTQ